MKRKTLLNGALKSAAMMTAAFIMFLSSCNNDDPLKPAPTLTLSSSEGTNLAGSQVTTTVTVDAPEGGATLQILVNGVADTGLADKTLAGSESEDVAIEYTIPASATVGTVINITFKAIDKKDQVSGVATFKVTVSAVPSKQIVEVMSTTIITGNVTWTADKIYRLNGFVEVGEDKSTAGATPVIGTTGVLTIEPGTVIYGKSGTPGGALIVHRGSKIIAEGTADKPIIFTSDKSVGTRKAGDWSGIVLCGKAANNIPVTAGIGPSLAQLEGNYGGWHGGGANPADDDNSGILKYVRIEYAGYPINPNQELNGLTFGSIGSGTVIDYVQVTYANDDSYEFFGGKVNPKHLIAYKGIDDDFDTDNGYSGQVQFGLGIRDANIADQSGSNGFECDNDGDGSANTPFTDATFSNMTIIGGKATSSTTIDLQFQNAAQIRRNAKQDIINSFFTGYPSGVFIDNQKGSTITNASNNELKMLNNILAGVEGWGGNGFGSAANTDEQTELGIPAGSNHQNNPRGYSVSGGTGGFTNGAFALTDTKLITDGGVDVSALKWFKNHNTVLLKWTDAGISASMFEPLNGTPTLLPTAGSPLLTGASFSGYTGFEAVSYKGAFGATDWTAGWVNWNPQQTDYSK